MNWPNVGKRTHLFVSHSRRWYNQTKWVGFIDFGQESDGLPAR